MVGKKRRESQKVFWAMSKKLFVSFPPKSKTKVLLFENVYKKFKSQPQVYNCVKKLFLIFGCKKIPTWLLKERELCDKFSLSHFNFGIMVLISVEFCPFLTSKYLFFLVLLKVVRNNKMEGKCVIMNKSNRVSRVWKNKER